MPSTFLQERDLGAKAQGLIAELSAWLSTNGNFRNAGIPSFDECMNEDLAGKVAPIWHEVLTVLQEIRVTSGLDDKGVSCIRRTIISLSIHAA